jgi:electron transfer flavoprotein alpha subunit
MEGNIWVCLQREGEQWGSRTLSAIGCAERAADLLGRAVEGVFIGGADETIPELPESVKRIHLIEGPGKESHVLETFGEAIKSLVQQHRPSVFVFPHTTAGEDLASWLGAVMDCGAVVGVEGLEIEGKGIVVNRKEFDQKVSVSYKLVGETAFVTALDGAFEPSGKWHYQYERIPFGPVQIPATSRIQIVESKFHEREVNLREARVIVAAGAGVQDEETMELVRRLAKTLGGEIGGTRAAVDAGFLTHDRQIGQTGERVRPDLYVACGISGAVQHRVGMMDSGVIISINIDPNAPIFRYSHYCVEGDLKEVLPKLIQLFAEARGVS